jgi:hypothetical protein
MTYPALCLAPRPAPQFISMFGTLYAVLLGLMLVPALLGIRKGRLFGH